jgi:hypothetical protein
MGVAAFESLRKETKERVSEAQAAANNLMKVIRAVQGYFAAQIPPITNIAEAEALSDQHMDEIGELIDADVLEKFSRWNRSKMVCCDGCSDTVSFFAGFDKVLFLPESTDEEMRFILDRQLAPVPKRKYKAAPTPVPAKRIGVFTQDSIVSVKKSVRGPPLMGKITSIGSASDLATILFVDGSITKYKLPDSRVEQLQGDVAWPADARAAAGSYSLWSVVEDEILEQAVGTLGTFTERSASACH